MFDMNWNEKKCEWVFYNISGNIFIIDKDYNMFDMIWDENKGEWVFYNIYCYRKELEHIDTRFKGKYDYKNVVVKTKLKNKASDKWLGKSEISSGIPYGVVVFDLDYEERYETNFYRPIEGICGENSNYEISLNEWKGQKTLQLKIKLKDDINTEIKNVLRDCYDNKIIIDFGFDYILVIEDLPLYSYMSIIDETKHNNNYPIKYYYYDDDYVKNYISKRQRRDEFDDLISIITGMKKDDTDNKVNKKKRLEDEKDVDYKYAPAYLKYLKEKNPDFFGEQYEKDLIIRRERAEKNKIIRAKKKAKQDKLDEIKRQEQEKLDEIKRQEQNKLNEIKRQEQERLDEIERQEQERLDEIKRQEKERLDEIKRQEQEQGKIFLDFLEQNKDIILARIKELEKQDEINKKMEKILTKK